MDFDIFCRNVADKVGNHKMLYCATSNNLCFCTTCQNVKTRKSHFSLNWIVLHAQCTFALSCWDSTDHWLNSRLDEEQLPPFTQWLTLWRTWLTQSMWVTESRMLCSLPRFCLVHPVDLFDSEGWFSSDQVIFLTVFRVFLVKKHAVFKWKDAISGFPVSPISAEAIVRCGGKKSKFLIAYFLGNIYAKNCRNWTVHANYSKL